MARWGCPDNDTDSAFVAPSVVTSRSVDLDELEAGRQYLAVPDSAADTIKEKWADVATRIEKMNARLASLRNLDRDATGYAIATDGEIVNVGTGQVVLPDDGRGWRWLTSDERRRLGL